MGRLRILTLVAVLLALLTYNLKHPEPATIAEGEELVVPKAWLANNKRSKTGRPNVSYLS
ncbi:hypothetical protein [Desertivirga xinjiangensis]|uniref:hypothetical protein n=1 Tax=Desertivirga xinjiangensis TaxID=539206 RepID=UPI002109E998|nr:hypothetical protein [Pedobacter xinjiangensis]